MGIAGGLRARLIRDNIYDVVNDGLTELGYMDANRNHRSVTVRSTPVPNSEEAQPNLVVVTAEDVFENYNEMGSIFADHTWLYYVDVYAEDNILGMQLGADVRDILQGRLTTVSRIGPSIDVYDLRVNAATPHRLFSVDIEEVDLNKSRFFEKPFQEHWWMVDFRVVDSYTTDEDELP